MTAFGMISRLSSDELTEGRAVRPMPEPPRPMNPATEGAAPRLLPDVETNKKRWNWDSKGPLVIQKGTIVPFVNRPAQVVGDAPDPVSLATSIQLASPILPSNSGPDNLPPILPAEVVPQPKAAGLAGFFDQELIPGVKNLYLIGGVGGLLLLLLIMRKK